MTKKELQIITGLIVTESKIDKEGKLQILDWLQNEASKVDIMGFLMDGRIKHFDESVEQIVIDRFAVHEAGGRIAKLRKTAMSVAGGTTYLGVPYLLYRTIRANFDKCTKKCGTYEFNTTRRQHCMIKCKVGKLSAELSAAQKTKDPAKIKSAQAKLVKAKAAMVKSVASFKKRGTSPDA